jgi:hypothetical protein
MQRVDHTPIHDSRAGTVMASRWTVQTGEEQGAAAEAVLSALPPAPGLVRFSVFRGVEDLTLFLFAQWANAAAGATDLSVGGAPLEALEAAAPSIRCDWQDRASPYRRFVSEACDEAGCLVVVRQPLVRPDPRMQRDWVDTVLAALGSEAAPLPGLCAASFFLSADGGHVLNLAEWTSAEAHRAALRRGSGSQYGSLGESPAWRAVRSHPGIRADHEVRRYELVGAVEPGDRIGPPGAVEDK